MAAANRPAACWHLFFASAALLALGSCGADGAAHHAPQALGLPQLDSALKAALPALYDGQGHALSRSGLIRGTVRFAQHVGHGHPALPRPIAVPAGGIAVQAAALLSAWDHCRDGAPQAMAVHYGLDSAGAFTVRLQPLCAAGPGHCLRIDADGSLHPEPDGLARWYAPDGPGHRYRTRLLLRPAIADSAWHANAAAPHSAAFAEEALRALIADNALAEGRLALVPVAAVDGAPPPAGAAAPQPRPGIAWVPEGVPLSDTAHPDAPYRHKALDKASPCPPLCPPLPPSAAAPRAEQR